MWCCRNKEHYLEKYLQLQKIDKVKKILSKGANPDEYSSSSNCSFLSLAITQRNEALVRLMLKAGASANQCTWNVRSDRNKSHLLEYPLQIAALQGNIGIVKALLEHGANINIGQDSKMGTPLHQAAKQGHKEVTTFLISKGADIIAIDRTLNTPLHKAATFGYVSSARELIEKGAPVNARNYFLSTPLHSAAQMGATEMIKLLLLHGADRTLLDVRNKSCLDVAKNGEIRSLLKTFSMRDDSIKKDEDTNQEEERSNGELHLPYEGWFCSGGMIPTITSVKNIEEFSRTWKSLKRKETILVDRVDKVEEKTDYWSTRRHASLHHHKQRRKNIRSQHSITRTQSEASRYFKHSR